MKILMILGLLFLAACSSIENRDERGQSALFRAAAAGDRAGVQRLLEQGADPHARTTAGHTTLMAAVMGEDAGIVELLLAKGVPIDARDASGGTALLYAAANEQIGMVRLLLARGASPLLANHEGKTPRSIAAERMRLAAASDCGPGGDRCAVGHYRTIIAALRRAGG